MHVAERQYTMTCAMPATRWQEALPTGNGKIGAMVYGSICGETILFNHECCWLGGAAPQIPDVSSCLSHVRDLLNQRNYKEADEYLPEMLKAEGYAPEMSNYHPAFNLKLLMDTRQAFQNYRRWVDFDTGEVNVCWNDGDLQFVRKLHVSRYNDFAVYTIACSKKGSITCRMKLAPHGLKESVDAEGRPYMPPIDFHAFAEGEWLQITGRYQDGNAFGGIARVVAKGGRTETDGEFVRVFDADEVLLLVGLFAGGNEVDMIPSIKSRLSEVYPDYEFLFNKHFPLHNKIFSRMTLDLEVKQRDTDNEQLLLEAYRGNVPTALIERLWDFGRYLAVCSCVGGQYPANLQGVWNGNYLPAWCCGFFNNINIEMNYWQVLPGNMTEAAESFFSFYESMLEDFRENARKLFGCRGIYVPLYITAGSGLIRDLQPHCIYWTGGAAWISQLFYDYYLFTGDEVFLLDHAIPFMKEAVLFYEDFLLMADDGYYTVMPSNSPENTTPAHFREKELINPMYQIAVNATMDTALIKEVLSNLCEACRRLGMETGNIAGWERMISRLRPYAINEDGAVCEWIHPDFSDNYRHRHHSHLYPVFPGFEVIAEEAPELFQAFKTALEKRMELGLNRQSGWSLSLMANEFARMGEGDKALGSLELLTRSCLLNNLLNCHGDNRDQGITEKFIWGKEAPFQIDANLGAAAAVLEMLVFSKPRMLKLLPALPAKWVSGTAKGILCRGGIEILILRWDMENLKMQVVLQSKTTQTLTVKFHKAPEDIGVSGFGAKMEESGYGLQYRRLTLEAGMETSLDITFKM